jgi:hypothetical protein
LPPQGTCEGIWRGYTVRRGVDSKEWFWSVTTPRAYQWVTSRSSNPSFPATSDEVISYQYYSDLDGVFDSSPTYRFPWRPQLVLRSAHGEVNWEIWTSVLPLYRDSVGLTIQALNRYFAKNLAYRTTPRTIPRAFLQVSEHWDAKTLAEQETFMAQMRDGQFSWTPFSKRFERAAVLRQRGGRPLRGSRLCRLVGRRRRFRSD